MDKTKDYIPKKRLELIRTRALEIGRKDNKLTLRSCIKQAIKEELSNEEIGELATIFDVNINDISNYVGLTFYNDAVKLKNLLNISIDEAINKIRGLK